MPARRAASRVGVSGGGGRSGSRGLRATATLLCLLQLLALALHLRVPCAQGHPVLAPWADIVADAMAKDGLDTNSGSRILAAMHVAQWRAVSDIVAARKVLPSSPAIVAAVAGAGKAVLDAMLPANAAAAQLFEQQTGSPGLREALKDSLAQGAAAAKAVLAERANDGATAKVPVFVGSNDPGQWRPTPPDNKPAATPQWAQVKPWVLDAPQQFRAAPPPALTSDVYKKSYLEVKQLGRKECKARSVQQTDVAYFWNTSPFNMWLSVIDQVTNSSNVVEASKAYAMLAVASADARIGTWDTKMAFNSWRPITAIQTGSPGLPADKDWTPLTPTPAHSELPSGHAVYAEAMAEILRRLAGKDAFPFTLASLDPQLPTETKTYHSFTEAVQETALSRVYDGEHFRHTTEASIAMGKKIGAFVADNFEAKLGKPATATAPAVAAVPAKEDGAEHRGRGLLRHAAP